MYLDAGKMEGLAAPEHAFALARALDRVPADVAHGQHHSLAVDEDLVPWSHEIHDVLVVDPDVRLVAGVLVAVVRRHVHRLARLQLPKATGSQH